MSDYSKYLKKVRKQSYKYDRKLKVDKSDNVSDNSKDTSAGVFFSIIKLLLLFLLIVNVYRVVLTGHSVTFEGFLNWLGSVNSTPFQVNVANYTITADWSIFNWLRDFLNIFTTSFGVLVYLCTNLLNLFVFLGQFIAFMFA